MNRLHMLLLKVLPSDDPLDRPDLDLVDYINEMFPNEQSLNTLDDTIAELNFKVQLRHLLTSYSC